MTHASETIAEPSIVDLVEPPTPAPTPVNATPPAVVEPEVPIIAPDTDTAETETEASPEPDVEKWVHPEGWTHAWLEFEGDNLAVRIPNVAALQALGSARHSGMDFQNRIVNRFMAKHLSPESNERIADRMIDPDDDFSSDSWSDLLNRICEIGGDAALKEAEALAAVQNGKGK